jgi:hypothetical protein
MAEVERIWRISTENSGTVEVRLFVGSGGDHQLGLERLGADPDQETFDVEVARALAQAMLEACEVAAALDEQVAEPVAIAR